MRLPLSLLCLATLSLAVTAYYPDCTVPPLQQPSYVDSASIRGTLDIFWSCFFTLLICTWTAQHLNVPAQGLGQESISTTEYVMSALIAFWSKLKWMIVALVLPELLVGRAVQDWMLAWRYAKDRGLQEFAIKDGQEWTIVHAFYANMGGFILKVRTKDGPVSQGGSRFAGQAAPRLAIANPNVDNFDGKNSSPSNDMRILPSQAGGQAGGLEEDLVSTDIQPGIGSTDQEIKDDKTSDRAPDVVEQLFYANARQLYVLRYMQIIETLPRISRHEIESRSRGDVIVKATAVFQVLWLVMSVIARAAQQLPVSQLEIASIAFAACTFLTYGFSWYKPQDVQEAFVIGHADLNSMQLELLRNAAGHSLSRHMLGFVLKKYEDSREAAFMPIPNDVSYRELEFRLNIGPNGLIYYNFVGTGIVLGGLVFGAIHCIAWKFDFPTQTEATLWRVASVLSTCVLMLHPFAQTTQGLLFLYFPILEDVTIVRRLVTFIFGTLTFLAVASYLIVRLFLMMEMLRCLFFLPPGAFVSSWPSIIPHIG